MENNFHEINFHESLLQNEWFIFSVMPEVFYPASSLLVSGREVDSGSTHCRNDVISRRKGGLYESPLMAR
jgi:hypothetical protein